MWEIISITFTRTTTTISFSHIVFTISVTRVIFTISSTGDHIIPCIRVFHQENDNNPFNYQVRTVIPFTKRTLLHQLLRDHTSTHRYHLYQCYLEQVTRGHNIVADGWAGAANPHPHPTPHPTPLPTQTQTQSFYSTMGAMRTSDGGSFPAALL